MIRNLFSLFCIWIKSVTVVDQLLAGIGLQSEYSYGIRGGRKEGMKEV